MMGSKYIPLWECVKLRLIGDWMGTQGERKAYGSSRFADETQSICVTNITS